MGRLRSYFMNHYPRTDFHELNQDWMISMLYDMINQVENFVEMNAVKYADPIQWDITRQYKKNTIVIDPITGTAYLSNKPVPIGVALSRTDYWSVVFDLGRFITLASSNFANSYESVLTTTATMPTSKDKWVVWNSLLYRANNDIHVGDRYVVDGNITRYTAEMFFDELVQAIADEATAREQADNDLHDEIVDESVARENADTALQEALDDEISAREQAITDEANAREDADTILDGKISDEITAREQAIADEADAREDADTILDGKISDEITAREQADAILESKIISSAMKPLDVTLHGVKGDGISNNSAAFQQILVDYPNYAYYFPKGVYLMGGDKYKGNINLVGDGDATIVDFIYEDLEFPVLNRSTDFDINQSFFSANNLKFTNTSGNYGFTMHVQSQGSVMRCFDIRNCTFYGDYGAHFINCITGNISSCDFVKNIIGIRFESSTNITVVECNWYSPVKGILIGTASDDSAGRKGGESIMLTSCQMIDGVTAIDATRHNYLQINNCMFDYFNLGVWLDSSRFCRMVNTYIGCDGGNKSGMHGYMAPNNYGCVFGYSSIASVPFTFEAINSEFSAYGDVTHIPVVMNGSGSTRGEDIDFISCRFTLIPTVNCASALYITHCDDILLDGNRFYAPNNNNLEHPYSYSNCQRVIVSNNDYVNCFKTNSTHIVPDQYNNASNKTYQEYHVATVSTNGSSQATTVTVNFNTIYSTTPAVVALVESSGEDYYKCLVSIHTLTTSSVRLNLYRPDANLSGTYKIHVIVMHDMY